MLVEDKNKWCWINPIWGDAGIPCDTLQGAIDNYFLNEPDRKGESVVIIGHPNYFCPEVDGDYVIEDIIDYQIDDEIAKWSDSYLSDVQREHIDELSKELTKVFRKWEKKHGYENKGYVVLETKSYPVDSKGRIIVV